MTDILKTTSMENDELWHKLINIFFADETDDEDFIYTGVWLSLNLFVLAKELHDNVFERFRDPKQFPAIRILGAIEYLYEDDDRESEIMLLMQLLQYAPNSQKQIEEVLFDPELSTYYKYSRMLLIDDDVFDDEDENVYMGNELRKELGDELSDEDPDIPF